MQVALDRAHGARQHILGEMNKAMDAPRGEVGKNAPRIVQIQIPTDKIRDVIGTGGKVIREIVEKTGAKVNVEDDGTVKVASANAEAIEAAVKWIKSLTSEPEVGQIYEGKVVKVMEFGAFVNFFGAKDGLVHVSQLARERVEKPGDVVKEGDTVKVKLLGFDDRGKVRLSMKVVDQATGADLSAEMGEEAEDHGPRRGGGGDHRGPRRHGGGGRDRVRGDRGERRERKESAE
jgi:polyribonucleotide nucleotidyltransferase